MRKLADLPAELKRLRKDIRKIKKQSEVANLLGLSQQRYSTIESTGKMSTELLFDLLDSLDAELLIVPKEKTRQASENQILNMGPEAVKIIEKPHFANPRSTPYVEDVNKAYTVFPYTPIEPDAINYQGDELANKHSFLQYKDPIYPKIAANAFKQVVIKSAHASDGIKTIVYGKEDQKDKGFWPDFFKEKDI